MNDLVCFHRQWNDPDVGRYLWDGEPVSRERVADVLHRSMASFEAEGFGLWAALAREHPGREPLGFAGLRRIEAPAGIELLYALDRAHWGQGLATKAAAAVLRQAFDVLGIAALQAATNPGNAASVRVLEKLGMRPAGRRRTDIEELVDYALEGRTFHV